jgi:hypothetical protein
MITQDDYAAAHDRYFDALERADPDGVGGPLGASVNQDAKYAVSGEVREAAAAFLAAGQALGKDTSQW